MDITARNDLAWFKQCCANKSLIERLKNIKLIVSDVDGTLTDGTVYVSQEGEGGRWFSVQDGFITKPALDSGLKIALVSGKINESTKIRGTQLGIPADLCIGGKGKEKITVIKELQEKIGVTVEQTLIFGDDFLDAQVKYQKAVGFYACPQNTLFYLQNIADLIIPAPGGTRAFRLLLDVILFCNKMHPAQELIDNVLAQSFLPSPLEIVTEKSL